MSGDWFGEESCLHRELASGYCASLLMICVNISRHIAPGRATCQLVTRGEELQSEPTASVERGVQLAVSREPHPAFTLTVDYLAFTLPSTSVDGVINRIGGEWSKCSGGYRGYPKSWIWNANSGIAHLGTGASRNPLEVNVDLSGALFPHGRWKRHMAFSPGSFTCKDI